MGAALGMTMVAGMPWLCAAKATPWAWLPAEEATTALSSPRSSSAPILLAAPRILKEPVFCLFSHFIQTSPPAMLEKVEL